MHKPILTLSTFCCTHSLFVLLLQMLCRASLSCRTAHFQPLTRPTTGMPIPPLSSTVMRKAVCHVLSGFVPQVRSRLTPQCPFDRLSCGGILDGDPLYEELSLCSKEPIYNEAQSSSELLDSPYRIPSLNDDFLHDCLAIPLSNKASSNHFTTGSESSQR